MSDLFRKQAIDEKQSRWTGEVSSIRPVKVWVPVLFRLGRAVGTELGGIEQMASSIQTGAVWMFAAAAVIIAGWLAWGREESKL